MSDTEQDYKVGPGKPPLHTRFKKGQSGNPRRRPAKNVAALVVAALNQPVVVTENGRRRTVTKREAVIAQLINKSATADLRATKMLLDILKDIDKADTRSPPETSPLSPTDQEVVANFVARIVRAISANHPDVDGAVYREQEKPHDRA